MRKDKLFKKVTAIMLAAAMVMSAAGCGNKNSAEAGGEAQPAGTESTAGGKESASAAAGDIDTSEPYTITWAYIGATYQDTDLVEAEMNKILQPEFNCTIDIIGFSWGEYTQKLNLNGCCEACEGALRRKLSELLHANFSRKEIEILNDSLDGEALM